MALERIASTHRIAPSHRIAPTHHALLTAMAQPLGVHLQYRLGVGPHQQGSAIDNDLFALLQAVHDSGSITHAAKGLGASYRHVWGSLKRWEAQLGEPLLTWTQGQPARLTPFALRLLSGEAQARQDLAPHIEALRTQLERVIEAARESAPNSGGD